MIEKKVKRWFQGAGVGKIGSLMNIEFPFTR